MERLQVVVIGAGQAGLSVSALLRERAIEHVVLDRSQIGARWLSERWDSFRLVTPNWQCRLPGFALHDADADGFMTGVELAKHLQSFAGAKAGPLRLGTTVAGVMPRPGGRFLVETSTGPLEARQVIVATGSHQRPRLPTAASELDGAVLQLHSSAYKNPEQLPAGAVLVVGSGQSGWQIARELHRAGRQVHWSMGRGTRLPRSYRGRDIARWVEELGLYDLPAEAHPAGDRVREEPNPYISDTRDGTLEDPRALAREGMVLHGRLLRATPAQVGFADDMEARLAEADDACVAMAELIDGLIQGRAIEAPAGEPLVSEAQPTAGPLELDVAAAGISTVIWATGYRAEWHRWIHADVFDEAGQPIQKRGVTSCPGLYFLGLRWLHTWGSGLLYGVAKDARHVVDHLTTEESRAAPRDSVRGRPV